MATAAVPSVISATAGRALKRMVRLGPIIFLESASCRSEIESCDYTYHLRAAGERDIFCAVCAAELSKLIGGWMRAAVEKGFGTAVEATVDIVFKSFETLCTLFDEI